MPDLSYVRGGLRVQVLLLMAIPFKNQRGKRTQPNIYTFHLLIIAYAALYPRVDSFPTHFGSRPSLGACRLSSSLGLGASLQSGLYL